MKQLERTLGKNLQDLVSVPSFIDNNLFCLFLNGRFTQV